MAARPGGFRLWRCASAQRPYFGRGSFWTPSRDYAGWFARWKGATYPELRPLGLYRADLRVPDAAVIDLRHHLTPRAGAILDAVGPDVVLAEADRLADRGVAWVLLTGDDPLGGQGRWTEAIYLGDDPIPVETV